MIACCLNGIRIKDTVERLTGCKGVTVRELAEALRQLATWVLGRENFDPLLDTARDGVWLLLVAILLRVFGSAIEWILGPSSFIEAVHGGLVYVAALAFAWRAIKRLFDWMNRG